MLLKVNTRHAGASGGSYDGCIVHDATYSTTHRFGVASHGNNTVQSPRLRQAEVVKGQAVEDRYITTFFPCTLISSTLPPAL